MKNKVDVIIIDFKVSGTRIFIPFKAICSVTNKEFSGEVVIEYTPKNKVVEYVDMERVVNKISSKKTTAEKLTNDIYSIVKRSITPKYLKVTVDVKHSKAHRPVQVWIESN